MRLSVSVRQRGKNILVDFDKRLDFGVAMGLQAGVTETAQIMQAQTSGNTPSVQLAALNHPFGRGATTPAGAVRGFHPLLPINRQTGILQSSLNVSYFTHGGNRAAQIGYTAPYAAFVLRPGGMPLMRARGYFPAVTRSAWPRYLRTLKRAIKTALS